MQPLDWVVFDILNNRVVGMWNDICDAEEFQQENEGEDDCWAVFHSADLIEVPA